ncbi:cytochrome C oxidase subunit IV [Bifidobacterium simiarum]|uniref:cytochrome C oxidase subunit IV n=1 Tax=Bifidobacterium simiarum TaxID=2045441 RepID=UPI001F0B2D6F|nr:cytochrome C oxidase subunit IV [Bifidobacterium simiarum]
MKSLLRIERVALIRWSTPAFMAVFFLPLLFFRYGNTGAVVQSAMVMALPIAAAGLIFSHARVPGSYRSFSIHDRLLLRFSLKALLLGVVVNICLTLSYGFAIGFIVSGRLLSSHTVLMLVFTAVVLSLACFVLRLWASPLVSWSIVAFFIVAGLTISSGMFENAPMLYAVIPTTWVLSGVRFAGYVIPVGVVVAVISAWLLFKAVNRGCREFITTLGCERRRLIS